jgi:hypothetical protein
LIEWVKSAHATTTAHEEGIMSLLFIKAHFYTHLPATSNTKNVPWEISVFGNIIITIDSAVPLATTPHALSAA